MGDAIAVWADAFFEKVGTEVKPFQKPKLVVAEGPFRISRDPLYLGFMVIIGGCAFLAGPVVARIGVQ